MPKCKRCNRELKNHEESGMGRICRMKANRVSQSAIENKIRVEPLFVRFQARRSYLVFTSPRATVTVQDDKSGRFAVCRLCGDTGCNHIALIAQIDNQKFPQSEVV